GFGDGHLEASLVCILQPERIVRMQRLGQVTDGIIAWTQYRHTPVSAGAVHRPAEQCRQQSGPYQRRLAAARRADHSQKACTAKFLNQPLALAIAPEEEMIFVILKGPQAGKRIRLSPRGDDPFGLERYHGRGSFALWATCPPVTLCAAAL